MSSAVVWINTLQKKRLLNQVKLTLIWRTSLLNNKSNYVPVDVSNPFKEYTKISLSWPENSHVYHLFEWDKNLIIVLWIEIEQKEGC